MGAKPVSQHSLKKLRIKRDQTTGPKRKALDKKLHAQQKGRKKASAKPVSKPAKKPVSKYAIVKLRTERDQASGPKRKALDKKLHAQQKGRKKASAKPVSKPAKTPVGGKHKGKRAGKPAKKHALVKLVRKHARHVSAVQKVARAF